MILPDHNAHLIKIEGDPVPADPGIGEPGAPPLLKWSGDSWAHVASDTREVIRGGMRVAILETKVVLPQNLPVWPATDDQLTVTLTRDHSTLVLKVREVNDRFRLLGYINVIARIA
jgi:hypothetical protein